MISHREETKRQQAGITLFKEQKVKDGWVLNLVKQNADILSTSLYNPAGRMVENKAFLIQKDEDIAIFNTYILLFEENPAKNYKAMSKLKAK